MYSTSLAITNGRYSSSAIAGGAFRTVPLPVPGLGEFHLVSPLATLFVAAQPGTESAHLQLTVPAAPALVGVELGFQALALPTTGSPYLGSATAVYFQ